MVLLGAINNSNQYIKKYTNISVTLSSNHLQRESSEDDSGKYNQKIGKRRLTSDFITSLFYK